MKRDSQDTANRHPIQVAARRTGLSADVLRIWEKRYQAVIPDRAGNGRRFYSDEDLERLRLLRQVTVSGRRIGDVAALSTEELSRIALEDLQGETQVPRPQDSSPPTAARVYLDRAERAVRELQAGKLESVLVQSLLNLGGLAFVKEVAGPLARSLGAMWEKGDLSPYHEHFASAVLRGVLSRAIASASIENDAPCLAVATPSGQIHELGALMVGTVASAAGWRVLFLGSDLPAGDIARAAREAQVQALALSLVYPGEDPKMARELRQLRSDLPRTIPILVGGAAARAYRKTLTSIGAVILESMGDLHETLPTLAR